MRIAPQNDSEDLAGGDSDWQRDNLRESLTRNGSTKPAGSRWGKVRDQASKLVIDGGLDPEVVLAADGGPVPQFATRFSEGLRQFATQFEPLTVCAREPAPVALRGHCRRPLHFSAADRCSPFSLCRAMARRQHPAACASRSAGCSRAALGPPPAPLTSRTGAQSHAAAANKGVPVWHGALQSADISCRCTLACA